MASYPAYIRSLASDAAHKEFTEVAQQPLPYVSLEETDFYRDNTWLPLGKLVHLEQGTANTLTLTTRSGPGEVVLGALREGVYRVGTTEYTRDQLVKEAQQWPVAFTGYPYYDSRSFQLQVVEAGEAPHWLEVKADLQQLAEEAEYSLFSGEVDGVFGGVIGRVTKAGHSMRGPLTGAELAAQFLPPALTDEIHNQARQMMIGWLSAEHRQQAAPDWASEAYCENLFKTVATLPEMAACYATLLGEDNACALLPNLRKEYEQLGTIL